MIQKGILISKNNSHSHSFTKGEKNRVTKQKSNRKISLNEIVTKGAGRLESFCYAKRGSSVQQQLQSENLRKVPRGHM